MAPFPSPSIRTALVLTVFVSITPALGILVMSWVEFRRRTIEHAKMEGLRQAEAFAEIQIKISDSTAQILGTLATLPAFRDRDIPAMGDILRAVHSVNYRYLNFSALDATGIVVASSLLRPGVDLGGRRHVRDAQHNRRFSPGEFIIGQVDDVPSFPYAYPLTGRDGHITGSLTAVYKLDSYDAVFREFNLPDQAFLSLVDRDGILLYHHPADESIPVGWPINGKIWDTIRGGADRGVFLGRGSDGVERFFSHRGIRLDGDQEPYMYVVYGIPSASVAKEIEAGLARSLGLMALVMALALGLAAAISKLSFGQPLADLVRTADALREGNLRARSSLKDGSPDLGKIGAALNTMAETIERRHRDLEEYGKRLADALEEKNVLLKEVHHRVKNNLQLILSMLRLQSDSACDSNQFRETMENRIAAMTMVHEMLYGADNQRAVDLASYAEKITKLVVGGISSGIKIHLEIQAQTMAVKLEKAVPFGLLLNELLTNALKHGLNADREGTLNVSLERNAGTLRLTVTDDGPGLPANFDPDQSAGVGLRLAAALASQLGGELRWENSGGARFSVAFPA